MYLRVILNGFCVLATIGIAAGCATTARPPSSEGDKADSSTKLSAEATALSLDLGLTSLGATARRLGDEYGVPIVLAYGMENIPIGPYQCDETPLPDIARAFAEQAACRLQEADSYFFFYPDEWGKLAETSLEGELDPVYEDKSLAVHFIRDTTLFNVFATISERLDVTIVADNAVAAARCGELRVAQAPLQTVLEAILKSAGVVNFEVESTPEYIFFHYPYATQPPVSLIGEAGLTRKQRSILDQVVSLSLPYPQDDAHYLKAYDNAVELLDVLIPLADQIGITVMVERGLENLPVNPVVMNNVRVRTAMDLLIRQWLRPQYGYVLRDNNIVICRQP